MSPLSLSISHSAIFMPQLSRCNSHVAAFMPSPSHCSTGACSRSHATTLTAPQSRHSIHASAFKLQLCNIHTTALKLTQHFWLPHCSIGLPQLSSYNIYVAPLTTQHFSSSIHTAALTPQHFRCHIFAAALAQGKNQLYAQLGETQPIVSN